MKAEITALIVLGVIACLAIWQLGVDGKEVPLSVASGIVGYIAKAAVDVVKP